MSEIAATFMRLIGDEKLLEHLREFDRRRLTFMLQILWNLSDNLFFLHQKLFPSYFLPKLFNTAHKFFQKQWRRRAGWCQKAVVLQFTVNVSGNFQGF